MKLVSQNYGKQRVRVLKVLRGAPRHEVKELEVGVRLEGDFESSYAAADNSKVVATDTMKNTVHVLAHRHLGLQTEPFALLLARHFLAEYPQVGRVTIETGETRWSRMAADGNPHPHAFVGASARPITKITAARGGVPDLESGIADLLIMKSTGSGFTGYPKDAYTTLPETEDRILATALRATWRWAAPPAPDFDFNGANATILEAMLRVFATNYSVSVQATLFEMAGAAFAACPPINRIALAMPNKHYLPLNLKPFGLENPNLSFLPTDEPHGQIEAVVDRS
jgi:urate oxidase